MNFFQNEKRTLDIIDELEERAKMQKAFEEAEAKRDMTFDEFIGKYLDHIDGRIDAGQRDKDRPITAEGAEDQNVNKSALVTIASQKDHLQHPVEEAKGEGADVHNTSHHDKLNESIVSRGGGSRGKEDLNKSKDST
jgi:hypothetical protein